MTAFQSCKFAKLKSRQIMVSKKAALLSISAVILIVSCGKNHKAIPVVGASSAPQAAVTCPQSANTSAFFSQDSLYGAAQIRLPPHLLPGTDESSSTIAVAYDHDIAPESIANEAPADSEALASWDLSTIGLRIRTFSVRNNLSSAIARFRQVTGVIAAEPVRYRRLLTLSPNDPAYTGNGVAPFYQSAASKGQWDAHVMNADAAWSFFSSSPVVGAKIAIIDTGADVAQTELGGAKVVLTKCFVTYPENATQTTGILATDTDGHGTNVAGIADADTDNSFEFAGIAWSAPLMIYRIFPSDVAGGCADSTSAQCSTTTLDEVSAINDAVTNGAKVINLSLGSSPPCTDTVEQAAIQRAIASGVVVVASAGNESAANLDCPASYPGVIAVGASSLSDSSNPVKERVASYSNYISGTGGGTFLVAPGGDPSSASDIDNLHWITNIYSGTAADLKKSCASDCTVVIAGTSQAAPHVTGVVSLMMAIRPNLTPIQIAQDLCATATNLKDSKQGCGRINAGAALALALTQ